MKTSAAPLPSSLSPLLLAGPTAAGKSAVALSLAEKLGGEIISVDSMQVYRGLDVGTAKPTLAERQRVTHHLIDILELTESFDAAQFARRAQAAVAEIQNRGRVPILCGGTGLYFKAFLAGLGEAPPANPEVRAQLEKSPLPKLLVELEARDPFTYQRIDRQNPRRVIRALEVIRLTGKPFSVQRASWSGDESSGPEGGTKLFFGLIRSSADLHARIEARVDEMFRRGLVAETERLLTLGLGKNPTAMQALGYRQVVEYLRGDRSLEATIALVKVRTRQFAKRQMTWFRGHAKVNWITLEREARLSALAERLAGHYQDQLQE
jgi:tRNA dimethylallyltransferase